MREALRSRLLIAQKTLLRWHRKNARIFSWRHHIRDPYAVMICEIMGQQTQASRIELFLQRFLKQFPNVTTLASAKQSAVILQWQGLGYNRRAINLHKAAQKIAIEHNGIIPNNEKQLLTLPGIGLYTARAILVFAFKKPVSAVDVNVSRVITRLSKRVKDVNELLSVETVHSINNEILPKRSNRDWHEAIMDLGATICTKRNPKCSLCPLNKLCPSSSLGLSSAKASIPAKKLKETLYFGQPKRIWRGRILKRISNTKKVSLESIQEFISKQYKIELSDALSICEIVIKELIKEGFIAKRSNGSFELA